MKSLLLVVLAWIAVPVGIHSQPVSKVPNVAPQPLHAHAIRLVEALEFVGSPLQEHDSGHITALGRDALTEETSRVIQDILDPYVLASVHINPEGRVKVNRGSAPAELYEGGWTNFLVKIENQAGVTAQLKVESPNAAPLLHASEGGAQPRHEHALTDGEVDNRFLEVYLYRGRPMLSHLSGLNLEYAILQIYSKDAGKREIQLGFNIGQGSQDIGFRNTIDILFDVRPSTRVVFDVKDNDGSPTMASFVITDGVDRFAEPESEVGGELDYRMTLSRTRYWGWGQAKALRGIYPLPSRRLATRDSYPDFYFHPQVYRADGEVVRLPPGTYGVTFTRGPEYLTRSTQLVVPEGLDSMRADFRLERWIDMASRGWYSADHHVHAAGCSHYESPEQGVRPEHMFRQIMGEDLNIAASLAWGPGWYYQKQFFNGRNDAMSDGDHILHQDVEVSGFPSSHAGHVVLLNLSEDDYPGTTMIEEWPSWTLPVLKWARDQGAAVGYAHSGWGLEPLEPTTELPNYVVPKMDGIGANEYIVTVTQGEVDFYSAGDSPAPWELNMWYHSLNNGFRVRLSGETDFPCIFDERVGLSRSYVPLGDSLSYDAYVESLKSGTGYVTDGRVHLTEFQVEDVVVGENGSAVALEGPGEVTVTARVTAFLPAERSAHAAEIAARPLLDQPYWHVERARIDSSRQLPVELVVDGRPVAQQIITADGVWNDVHFTHHLDKSSWMALRVYPAAHTNPIFVEVNGRPIRDRRSAEWARAAVDQCWKMKVDQIREEDRPAARAAYDRARAVYGKMTEE